MTAQNSVVLITGAAGGLGKTASIVLAKMGVHVILLDKSIPKLESCYDVILSEGGVEPMMYPFDLAGATEEDYYDLSVAIENQYGSLQGLLHSAVEFTAFTPVVMHKTRDWGHILNVNLNAPFLLTRVLLPVLSKSDSASIVFTSDSAVREPKAYSGAYGVSKIALEGFAKILAEELESAGKIRVNTLIPGVIDSPMRKKAYPAEDKAVLPGMMALEPVYRYLFSDASVGVNGQAIHAQDFKVV